MLCDVLAADFTLSDIQLVTHGGHSQPLMSTRASIGEGLLLDHTLNPPDKVLVKVSGVASHMFLHSMIQVSLSPRPGVLGQLVLFDFSSFYLVRCITVHVISEQEDRMIKMSADTVRKRPEKM